MLTNSIIHLTFHTIVLFEKYFSFSSCFVIITNHKDLSAKELLSEYREQTVV
jgi:hypothetical protein